ncbi:hypothetical protein EI427_03750 [Flammeovirga pectinis]|uniref:PPM-type phosphatase domain-containing protein n=1 Tax=Flammeovirga pectinis TaxID=2494373 RepID=A0A3Q9FNZ6_9BACT|nr:SpoIIE family protein phosphatase [Flammeovirga pectinis]AZQ61367.1 hypothetical protein EI427_03750 [Flammeovirga pectinis]
MLFINILSISTFVHADQVENSRVEQVYNMPDNEDKVNILASMAIIETERNPSKHTPPFKLINDAIKVAKRINNKTALTNALNTKAIIFRKFSTFDQAIDYHLQAIKIAEKSLDETEKVDLLMDLGCTYRVSLNYQKAKDCFNKAKTLAHDLQLYERESICILNNAYLYISINEQKEALTYFNEAIKLSEDKKITDSYILSTLGKGISYTIEKPNFKASKKYFISTITSSKKKKRTFYEGVAKIYLGRTYLRSNNLSRAYNYFVEAVAILSPLKNSYHILESYKSLDDVLNFRDFYAEAISYKNSLKYYRGELSQSQYNAAVKEELELFGNPDKEELDHLRNALSELKMHYSFLDSINTLDEEEAAFLLKNYLDNQKKKLNNLESDRSYLSHLLKETEKSAKQKIELLEQKNLLQRTLISKQYWIGIALILIVVFISSMGIMQFRVAKQKKKTNLTLQAQNLKISDQNIEIQTTADQLHETLVKLQYQNKKTEESIQAGWKIQNAMLPTTSEFEDVFSDYFVYYQPRDIVSGDFYWVGRKEDGHIIVAALDCTGHGIPGAFMSMMGNALIHQVVQVEGEIDPSIILQKIDNYISKALHQGKNTDSREGMDVSICVINPSKTHLEFSGAKNPLLIINHQEPTFYKGTNRHVGGNRSSKKTAITFDKSRIEIRPSDRFYIYSDGYQDQFGGPENKKFMRKQLIEKLCQTSNLSMGEQKEVMQTTFLKWKGEQKQLDDLLLIGFKC